MRLSVSTPKRDRSTHIPVLVAKNSAGWYIESASCFVFRVSESCIARAMSYEKLAAIHPLMSSGVCQICKDCSYVPAALNTMGRPGLCPGPSEKVSAPRRPLAKPAKKKSANSTSTLFMRSPPFPPVEFTGERQPARWNSLTNYSIAHEQFLDSEDPNEMGYHILWSCIIS